MKKIVWYVLLLVMAFVLGTMIIMGATTGDWVTPLCERIGSCLI